jgi:hypothetical protein
MEPCRSRIVVKRCAWPSPEHHASFCHCISTSDPTFSVSACFWSDGLLGHQIRSEWMAKPFVAACPGQVGWFDGYEQRGVLEGAKSCAAAALRCRT